MKTKKISKLEIGPKELDRIRDFSLTVFKEESQHDLTGDQFSTYCNIKGFATFLKQQGVELQIEVQPGRRYQDKKQL